MQLTDENLVNVTGGCLVIGLNRLFSKIGKLVYILIRR